MTFDTRADMRFIWRFSRKLIFGVYHLYWFHV